MNPERWQELKRIFEAALEKEGSAREAFLETECATDPALRKEVQALLDGYSSDSFLEKPAYAAVPELFQSDAGDALVGKRLGSYEITGKVGQGGMGIVYLGRDSRLDRPVAIKMLAPRYTSNPQYRERLQREAQAAAKLSHPGIATVYSLEEFGKSLYIVSEYVRGNTLLKVIEHGPVPVAQLMDIALQIVRALAAAHEQGIVHRDLKPENVIWTDSGIVKILDFGLARLEPDADLQSPARLTRFGVFLGTPAYASPEQLLGNEVDRRSDIFSFGVLLYELATGKHPFGAADSVSTIARILEAEVRDLSEANPEMPKMLALIVRRCLKKKPEDRYSSTRDLLLELEELAEGRGTKPEPASTSALWWWQFHQACAGFGYYGMLYPLWRVKKFFDGAEGSLYFFPAIIAVGIAANLRLHLWFTSRFYITELPEQRRKVGRWIRWADCVFVAELAVSAIRMHKVHGIWATFLMAVAIGALVAFTLIEPTTTKAAFGKNDLS